MSIGSKHDEMIDFYSLLNAFINTCKVITTEAKDCKEKILSYIRLLYDKYLGAYKKNYDSEKVKDEEKESVTINGLK